MIILHKLNQSILLGPNTKNYEWAEWGEWSTCSVSCAGEGTHTRTRSCIAPSNGGFECPDSQQSETDTCNEGVCPGKLHVGKSIILSIVFFIQSIDYLLINLFINIETEKQLGSWTNDGECIAKGNDPACGPGHQRQLRTCIDGTNDQCTAADTVQTISCLDAGTALPDCIFEKGLGNWVNDGNCIATGDDPSCGPGNQTQKRTCTDGSTDKCNDSDLEQVIPCSEAGTALPDCG